MPTNAVLLSHRLQGLKPYIIRHSDDLKCEVVRSLGPASFTDYAHHIKMFPTGCDNIYIAGSEPDLFWRRPEGGTVLRYGDPVSCSEKYLAGLRKLALEVATNEPDANLIICDIPHINFHDLLNRLCDHQMQLDAENTVNLVNSTSYYFNKEIGAETPSLSKLTMMDNKPYFGALYDGFRIETASYADAFNELRSAVLNNNHKGLVKRHPFTSL